MVSQRPTTSFFDHLVCASGRRETFEGFESLRSVKQIDRNVLVAAFDIWFATGDGDHVPVVQSKKVAQKISAHDSRRAGNQRLLAVRHERAPSVLSNEAGYSLSFFEWHWHPP